MRRVDATAPDELLHKARIRGKRLRYVAEALGEKRVVRRAKVFQDVVGEHQDAVVAEQRFARPCRPRARGGTARLGLLIERQRERRTRARDDLPKSWKQLKRAAASAWS